MQASAGNAENIRDDLNDLDKAVSAVLGLRTIERNQLLVFFEENNQLLVSIAKSKFTKHRDEKNEKITKPEELVRLYDLLIQVGFLALCLY
jgi:signal recognition particle subunit SRP68